MEPHEAPASPDRSLPNRVVHAVRTAAERTCPRSVARAQVDAALGVRTRQFLHRADALRTHEEGPRATPSIVRPSIAPARRCESARTAHLETVSACSAGAMHESSRGRRRSQLRPAVSELGQEYAWSGERAAPGGVPQSSPSRVARGMGVHLSGSEPTRPRSRYAARA